MIVVSDTTPLITLMKVNQLDLLEKLFDNVKIPKSVYAELTENPLYQEEAEYIKRSAFIGISTVNDTKSVSLLRKAAGLDKGESEAIILTEEIFADLLLMDERKGRLVAKQMGIAIVGTLGILLSAFEANILTSEAVIECLDNMKKNGRWIGETLYNDVMSKIQSNKIVNS